MGLIFESALIGQTPTGGGGGTSDVTKAYVDRQDKALGVRIDKVNTEIQNLDADKMGVIRYPVANDKVSQLDALDILSNPAMYEGQIIEFLTNGDLPNKSVALGFVMTAKTGDTYLLTDNLDGTTTQWNKDYYEKHNFECKSLINETVDLDNFTIDVRGDAPYIASVQKAINKPQGTSDFGLITVLAYSIDKQIQIYRDIETGLAWRKIVTGTADNHSFSTWEPLAVSKAYVDTELNKKISMPRVSENLSTTNPVIPNAMPNTVYKFGTINSLTVTAIPNSVLGITVIFTAGTSTPTINLPSTLEKINFVEFEASKKYVIAVENNIAVMGHIGE